MCPFNCLQVNFCFQWNIADRLFFWFLSVYQHQKIILVFSIFECKYVNILKVYQDRLLFYSTKGPARMVEATSFLVVHWYKYVLLWMSFITDLLLCHVDINLCSEWALQLIYCCATLAQISKALKEPWNR